MACDAEREALREAYDRALEAQEEMMAAEGRFSEALDNMERNCGYFNVDEEFVIDPLEEGDPDFDAELGPCPGLFSEAIEAWLGIIPLRAEAIDRARTAFELFQTLQECKHELVGSV